MFAQAFRQIFDSTLKLTNLDTEKYKESLSFLPFPEVIEFKKRFVGIN